MPHVTRRGHSAFGNSHDPAQRATSVPDDDVPSYEQTRREITAAFQRLAETGERPSPAALARFHAGLRLGYAEGKAMIHDFPGESVVYYIRVGNRIKIGYTQNLRSRIDSLAAEELLGWEPGAIALERQRHRQFAGYRVAREWFEDCRAIRDHIAKVNAAR